MDFGFATQNSENPRMAVIWEEELRLPRN